MKSSRWLNRSRAISGAALAVLGLSASFADASPSEAFWVGGNTTGKWETAGNWTLANPSTDSIPPIDNSGYGVRIGNGNDLTSTATFDQKTMDAYVSGGTITSGAPLHIQYLVLGDGPTANGTLDFNGGTLNTAIELCVGGWPINNMGTGTLAMSGGQINASETTTAPAIDIGYANLNGTVQSSGTLLLTAGTTGTGGVLNFAGAHMAVGGRNSIGYVDQRSGLVTGGTLQLGAGTTGSSGGSAHGGMGQYFLSGNGAVAVGTLTVGLAEPGDIAAAGITPIDAFNVSGGELSVGTINTLDNLVETTSFTFTGGTVTANYMTMQLTQNGGTLSPGNGSTVGGGTQVGSMILGEETNTARKNAGNANYIQNSGALLIDINGNNTDPTNASNNDVVHLENDGSTSVNLTATLNGTISLRLASNYHPSTSDVFGIVTADTITPGTAAVTTAPITGNSDIFTPSIASDPSISIPTSLNNTFGPGGILELTFTGYAKLGDANKDQTVNSSDFAALAMHYGQTSASNTVGWEQGDFNGDGTVNALDFNALASDYGASGFLTSPAMGAIPDGAAPASLGSVVPEPMSATLILGIAGIGLARRKRNSIA